MRFHAAIFVVLLALNLMLIPFPDGVQGRVNGEVWNGPSQRVTLYAAGRGNPWVNLKDGVDLPAVYSGAEALLRSLEGNLTQPLALASGDFDEDGIPDLVSGYAGPGGGVLTLHRGNVDAIYPYGPDARQREAEGKFTDIPFLSPGRVFDIPISPDFLGVGDFDNDGHLDVLAAAYGEDMIHLLPGDGQGSLSPIRQVELPGVVTSLVTGEVNRPDGLIDLVVGVVGPDGPQALIFEGPQGALVGQPEAISLPGRATALALGQLDEHLPLDLAVGSGNELLVVHGRDRKGFPKGVGPAKGQSVVSRQSFLFTISAITISDFSGNNPRGRAQDLALLSADGIVHIVARSEEGEGGEWASLRQVPAIGTKRSVPGLAQVSQLNLPETDTHPSRAALVPARVSSLPGDDLIVVDPNHRQLHVLSLRTGSQPQLGGSVTTLDVAGVPVAVLPMRLNGDALSDLVVLRDGGATALTLVTTQAVHTFTVNSTGVFQDGDLTDNICDTGSSPNLTGNCTLLAAIQQSNASAGADAIHFSVDPVGTHVTLAIDVPIPTITDGVTIDGTTQGCGQPVCIEFGSIFSGGFQITGGNSTIRGFAINGTFASGIRLDGSGNNVIEGNYLGTDLSGTVAVGGTSEFSVGVAIFQGSSNNTIGGDTAAARNLISGNPGGGISIQDNGSTGNVIKGNYIGTDVTGTVAMGNGNTNLFSGFGGVLMAFGANNNTIGGPSASARNIISASIQASGIDISDGTSGNLVQGNFIGTDVTGTVGLGNDQDGIGIFASTNNTVGGSTPETRNIISGNGLSGVGIFGNASGNVVQGNYIGTDVTGSVPLGNDLDGVAIGDAFSFDGTSGNTIGGINPGTSPSGNCDGVCNLIMGNGQIGVSIAGAINGPSNNNAVRGNSIFGNGGIGIDLGADGVTINDVGDGDTGPNNLQNWPTITSASITGGSTTVEGTLDSTANTTFRIEFFSNETPNPPGVDEGKKFLGSASITTNGAGQAPFSKTFQGSEKRITATATDPSGNTSEFFKQPIIVNTTGDSSDLNPGDRACDTGNETPQGNPECTLRAAIEETNAHVEENGIAFRIPGAGVPTIQPTSALPVISDEVVIDGTSQPDAKLVELKGVQVGIGEIPGLKITAGNSTVKGMVINQFPRQGILLEGAGKNSIVGNYIGTDPLGASMKGNGDAGIKIMNSFQNTIGGPQGFSSEGDRNVISGNGVGVEIVGGSSTLNVVQGNYIGTDKGGTQDLGNTFDGVRITGAPNNRVGGTNAGERNIISGNTDDGVEITGATATNNRVLGNNIGTDKLGSAPLANGGEGVFIQGAPGNFIGDTAGTSPGVQCTGGCNLISGNGSGGVQIEDAGVTGTQIKSNYIGTDSNGECALNAGGTCPMGNGGDGISIKNASGTVIGGTTPQDRNIVSANTADGIFVESIGVTGAVIQGNYIGTNDKGDTLLGNRFDGIRLNGASGNTIGGTMPTHGNIIAGNGKGNGGNGVSVVGAATRNSIRHNSIFDNDGLGIDLGRNGFTPNDGDDTDAGPNNLQNFPVFSSTAGGGNTVIAGVITSTASTNFILEFFHNTNSNTFTIGQGKTFIGTTNALTDPDGVATFQVTFPGNHHNVAATATDSNGNTSEFSKKSLIDSVEFTQAIQIWQPLELLKEGLSTSNRPPVPIVALKPAVMRIYGAQVSEASTNIKLEISGPLSAFKNVDVSLSSTCAPLDRRRVQRGCVSIDHFFVPPVGDWTTTLTVKDQAGEILETHDFTIRSTESNALTLNAVSVCDNNTGGGNWQCGQANTLGRLALFLKKILPSDDVRVRSTRHQVRVQVLAGDLPMAFGWWISVGTAVHNLFRNHEPPGGVPGEQRYYYGMARAGVPGPVGGVSPNIPGRGAVSRVSTPRFDTMTELNMETVAHETGHMLGRRHTNTINPQAPDGNLNLVSDAPPGCYNLAPDGATDWPYNNNNIQSGAADPVTMLGTPEVGFDVMRRVPVLPENHFETMGYCSPRWISPLSYNSIMRNVLNPGAFRVAALLSPTVVGPFWAISGSIEAGVASFAPLFTVETTGSTDAGNGSHRIEVRDSGETVLFTRNFDPIILSTEAGSGDLDVVAPPFFTEIIPVQASAASIVVLDESNADVGRLLLAGAAPVVNINFPTGGETLSGPQTLAWSATDSDGGSATFWAQFSADGGSTWTTLGASLAEGTLVVDFDELPGSQGNALIRVLASDGVNTGVAVSNPFTVPEKLPEAQILFPENGESFRPGDLVWLQGFGFDMDDGSLDGVFLQWASAKDGPLGNGADLPLTALSEGTHVITLTVTDSDGNRATDTITIFVAEMPPVGGTCGDLNGDEVVNVFDAIIDLQIIVGLINPTATQLKLGDVVRDGTINVFDAILLLQHIVGLTQITECGPPAA